MIRDVVTKVSVKLFVGPFGSYLCIISMGDAANVISLAKIRSLVTTDKSSWRNCGRGLSTGGSLLGPLSRQVYILAEERLYRYLTLSAEVT